MATPPALLQELTGVLFGHQDRGDDGLFVYGLAFGGLDGFFHRPPAHHFGKTGHVARQAAGYHRADGLSGGVEPDYLHFPGEVVGGDGLHRAERHLVVGREDGFQIRVRGQQVLHDRHAERALAVGGLHGDTLDSRRARNRLAKAGQALLMRGDAQDSANHRNLALATQQLDDVLAGDSAAHRLSAPM